MERLLKHTGNKRERGLPSIVASTAPPGQNSIMICKMKRGVVKYNLIKSEALVLKTCYKVTIKDGHFNMRVMNKNFQVWAGVTKSFFKGEGPN